MAGLWVYAYAGRDQKLCTDRNGHRDMRIAECWTTMERVTAIASVYNTLQAHVTRIG